MRIVLAALLLTALATGVVQAKDGHAGYYYPPVTSTETYEARAQVMEEAERQLRIGFIVAQTALQAKRDYPPRFAMYAKGGEAEKLIIVGLDGESFRTLYRARAVLAQLTARARKSDLFQDLAVQDLFTFFDLARMLGFEQITVTDGDQYAHQIMLR